MRGSERKRVSKEISDILVEATKGGSSTVGAADVVKVFTIFHSVADEDKKEVYALIKDKLQKEGIRLGERSDA